MLSEYRVFVNPSLSEVLCTRKKEEKKRKREEKKRRKNEKWRKRSEERNKRKRDIDRLIEIENVKVKKERV